MSRRSREEVIAAAIRGRRVLRFIYHEVPRIVEPQACGISTAGHFVLRAYQRAGGSRSRQPTGLKLFDVAKISRLEIAGEKFAAARPEHHPKDSAMRRVLAALPAPRAVVRK